MKKLILICLVCIAALASLGNKGCSKKGPTVNSGGIPYEKFCGVLSDYKVTPKGAKVSACGTSIPQDYLTVVDDACSAHIEAIREYYPEWTLGLEVSSCDILLLEPEGILTTIPNYPRPYLTVAGINTAGTVLFGNERIIIILPHYAGINWSNKHFEFYSAYNEDEHGKGYLNRNNPPVNEWRNYIGAYDVHPQKPYIEKSLPDYAKTTPSLTDQNLNDGLQKADPVKLTDEQSKAFFDRLDAAQANFK